MDRIAALQDLQDEQDKNVKKCDVKRLIMELKKNGFQDAAVWIEKKIA